MAENFRKKWNLFEKFISLENVKSTWKHFLMNFNEVFNIWWMVRNCREKNAFLSKNFILRKVEEFFID